MKINKKIGTGDIPLKRLIAQYPEEVLHILKNDSRIMARQEKRIAELEKENAELKSKLPV